MMFGKKLFKIFIILVVLNVLLSCHSPKVKKNLDSFFNTLSNQYHLNGCVLIADKGKITYKKAFGY